MNWKTRSILVLCVTGAYTSVHGQQQTKNTDATKALESAADELVLFKFEPNYTMNSAQRRELFLYKRRQIDSLQISDRKKEKLIKALYKDLNSKEFDKALLADQLFQEDIDNSIFVRFSDFPIVRLSNYSVDSLVIAVLP